MVNQYDLPHKNPDEKREYHQKYCREHREKFRGYGKKFRENNRDRINAEKRQWYHENIISQHKRSREKYIRYKEQSRESHRKRRMLVKKFIVAYYTDGKNCCACCGEKELQFMTVDHINHDGAKHRKSVPPGRFYEWLIKNYLPDGFQILCFNCNCVEARGRICPHRLK